MLSPLSDCAARPCQRNMSQMYGGLGRAMAAGLGGSMGARNSPEVPSQRCARWRRLKELKDSMKAEWLPARGRNGRMGTRRSRKVPSQRCARWRRLKELKDSMKAEWLAESESAESDRIVLPSRRVQT